MGLRDVEATLPPGFRFYPSDEELVCHYLRKKVANERSSHGTMVVVDLHTCEPWQLPDVAKLGGNEWYFFSFRDRKYATGVRANRATTSGYWKATGKDRPVIDPTTREVAGMRKTLVFYRERAPNGIKTDWVMHEFRLESPHAPPKEDWVLCRVLHKSKGEPSKFSLENEHDNIGCSSPYMESSPPSIGQSILHGYDQDQNRLFINGPHYDQDQSTLLNSSVLPFNFLDFPHGVDDTQPIMGTSDRVVDDYGFLLDMGPIYQNLGVGGSQNSEEEGFENVKNKGLL
ncbi:NAC domain-containing protein 21/22-like isoform X1 [Magnolia sinica]|uniref:NAC domain-containing protein 21/22-like isoform X1 n=1 Tax=Magnolia sinica TaxID=86752 RepID=UPI00265808ED|nr:NAC domain-containing protein 21/22-like isoform X1 [Magnolia sinica]